jgi:hypothetical protein
MNHHTPAKRTLKMEKLLTGKELIKDLDHHIKKQSERYQASKSTLTLLGGGYRYHIDRKRINTPGKVLHWIAHLSDKGWFTMDDLQTVLWYAHTYNGVQPYAEGI